MSGLLLAAWVVGCVVVAWGLLASGYNGDDGWSVVFLVAAFGLVVAATKAGWFA